MREHRRSAGAIGTAAGARARKHIEHAVLHHADSVMAGVRNVDAPVHTDGQTTWVEEGDAAAAAGARHELRARRHRAGEHLERRLFRRSIHRTRNCRDSVEAIRRYGATLPFLIPELFPSVCGIEKCLYRSVKRFRGEPGQNGSRTSTGKRSLRKFQGVNEGLV